MKVIYSGIIACTSLMLSLTASAASQPVCKFVAHETALHPDGSSNPWVEDIGGISFPMNFSTASDTYQDFFVFMNTSGSQNAEQAQLAIGPTYGFESMPSENLFSGTIDFTAPVDQTFAVSGNPGVLSNSQTVTTLQAIELVCSPNVSN